MFVLRVDGRLKFELFRIVTRGGGGHTAPPYLIVSKTIKRRRKFTEHKMLFLSLLQLFPTYFLLRCVLGELQRRWAQKQKAIGFHGNWLSWFNVNITGHILTKFDTIIPPLDVRKRDIFSWLHKIITNRRRGKQMRCGIDCSANTEIRYPKQHAWRGNTTDTDSTEPAVTTEALLPMVTLCKQ